MAVCMVVCVVVMVVCWFVVQAVCYVGAVTVQGSASLHSVSHDQRALQLSGGAWGTGVSLHAFLYTRSRRSEWEAYANFNFKIKKLI
jgi:hypothetical protein